MSDTLTLGIAVDASPAETGAGKVVAAYRAIEQRADAMAGAVNRADAAMARMGSGSAFDRVTRQIAGGASGVDAMSAAMERAERVEKAMQAAMNSMADASAKQTAAINSMNAALEKLLNTRKNFNDIPKPKPAVDETEAQAIDRITQRMAAAKAAREAQAQATTQQKAAQDALNASVAAGAGGQVSNAGLLATAKAAQDATVSVEKLTKARIDDEAAANALVKSADTLVGKYAPLIKQQQQLAADKEAFNKLQKAGTLTAAEEAAILSGLTAKTQAMDAAQKSLASSMKLSHNNTLALNAAFVNFGQSIMAGMNPMTAFVTQVGQAAPALGELAVKSGTSGAAVAGIAAPIIATAAAIAIAVVSYEKYTGSLRDFDNVNKLAGNSVGMTRDQMAAYADSIASATGVSSAFARETIAAYTKLGAIATPVMSSLIAITKDYAAVTGQSKDEAAKALGAMFTDPAKGAQELATKYGVINGAQLLYIQQLTASGQKTQAQTLLVDALGRRVAGAAEQTSIWARTWDAVGTAASEAATKIGRAIDEAVNGMSPQRQLAQTEKRISELKASLSKPSFSVPLLGEYEGTSIFNSGKAVDTTKDRAELAALEASVSQLRLRITEDNRRSFIKGMVNDANKASVAAVETTQRYDDLGQMLNKANADLATLQKGLGPNMGQAAGQGSKAVEALQNQIADLNKVRTSGLDLATYKSQELAKIDAKYAGQVGPQVAVQIAQEKERINVLGTATTAAQRKAQVDTATASAQAGVTHAAAEATVQLSLQTQAQERLAAAAGQGEAAQRRATIENTVAAAAVKGLEGATRTAMEAQEKFTQALVHNEFVAAIDLEVAATGRLVKAMGDGVAATRDAEIYNKAIVQAMKEVPPTYDAAGKATGEFAKHVDDAVVSLKKQQDALDSKAFADYEEKLKAQNRQLQLQQKLIGATPSQAAKLQVEYDINEQLLAQKRTYADLSDAEKAVMDRSRERALQNAELEQQINRQKDAYDTIAQSLEKAFERVGDAIVNAFVEGKGSAVDFGNIAKGILSSLLTDLVKMAAVRPLSNALLGTNYGTIYDLAGGSSSANQNGGMGGMGGQALSLGSKFMPSSWTSGITSSIDQWGASALGIGQMTSLTPSASVQASQMAMLAEANPGMSAAEIAAGYQAPSAGTAVTGGLTSYLGALGAGFAAGGLIGPLLANGNKAVGGLAGGASGAAAGALVGSIVPGVGTLIGALLGGAGGGLGGLLGTQKPTVGKTASADVTVGAGGVAGYGNILTDNKGDPEAGKALGQTVAAIFNAAKAGGGTLAKDFGFGQTEKGGYYIGGSVPMKEFKDDFAGMIRYALLDQGGLQGGGVNTLAALRNSTSKDATEFGKDVALGASIDAGNTALKEMVKTLSGVTDAAKKATTESFAPMFEELSRAQKLGIDGAYKALATDQLKAYLDQLRNPPDYTQMQTDVATLAGQFAAAKEAYAQLNPEMVTYVDQIQKETMARLAANQNKQLDQQIAEASGRGYVNQISGFLDTLSVNARSLAAVGEPATRAQTLFNASLTGLLKTLTTDQLTDVVRTFGGDIGTLATQLATANDNVQQATQFETLIGRIRQDNAQTELSALNEQRSAANSLLTASNNLAKSAASARQSMLTGDMSILSPEEKLKEALKQFDDLTAKYNATGDTDVGSQAVAMRDTVLGLARGFYASSEGYVNIFNHVSDGLTGVESAASRQASLSSQQVSRLDTQISIQTDTLKALQTVPSDIAAIIAGINSGNSSDIWKWSKSQDTGTQTKLQSAVLDSFTNADIERLFGGFSDIQQARADDRDFNLAKWFQDFGKAEVLTGTRSIPGFATGTDYAPGGLAWVGEKGPELMQLPTGSRIYTNAESMGIARSWAANDRWGGSNVVPYQPARAAGSNRDAAADEVRQLRQEVTRLHQTIDRMAAMLGDQGSDQIEQLSGIRNNTGATNKKWVA